MKKLGKIFLIKLEKLEQSWKIKGGGAGGTFEKKGGPCSTMVNCPVCYSTLPALSGSVQPTDCLGCPTLPREEHKTRFNKLMTLISVKVKDYVTYSSGFRLELQALDDSLPSFAVIFPNKSFYSLMSDLRVGSHDNVLGWKAGKVIDVIDF